MVLTNFLKSYPKIIFNILYNKPLPIYGSGTNIREWIYVKDTCEALIKIFLKGKSGENYNIGSGIKLTNIKIAKKNTFIYSKKKNRVKIGNKSKIIFVKDRPGHDKMYSLNSNKIKNLIKWKRKHSISQGLIKTFKWYLNNTSYFKKISKKNISKRFGLKI